MKIPSKVLKTGGKDMKTGLPDFIELKTKHQKRRNNPPPPLSCLSALFNPCPV